MEFLVCIRDKPFPADHPREKAVRLWKRGWVIHAAADGWPWSEKERTNSDWLIIRAPLSAADGAGLVTPEIGDPLTRILRKRGFRIDLDALGIGTARTAELVSLSRDAVRNARVQLTAEAR